MKSVMKTGDAYTDSFGTRGSKYDSAMKQYPDARQEEFMAVVDALDSTDQGRVLDVPAGGGYLARYLPERFQYESYERVAAFKGGAASGSVKSLLPFPHTTGMFDAVISVAGVHHFSDKRPLFEEMSRVARPGGKLVLADVHEDSPVAQFLDGYIDASNSTGHRGFFLNSQTAAELEQCGWQVTGTERRRFHWRFNSIRDMNRYCHLLFDICHDDFAETERQIADCLGIDPLDGGQVGMRWELFIVTAENLRQA